jgi:hypothetical protein
MKTVSKKQTVVSIPPIDFRKVRVTLIGETPLLVHKFSEKSKREMDDKQQGAAKNKKAARDPHAEFQSSLYKMQPKGKKERYGMPASGLKLCAVSACRYTDGLKMTSALGAFHVTGDEGGLIEILGDKPVMDDRIVRIGNFGSKVAQSRYRGRFDNWKVSFDVRYNARVISAEQLINLYENAGFSVGLCELRPEKKGSLGMFRVERA